MRNKSMGGIIYLLPILCLIAVFFLYPALLIFRNSFYHTRFGIHFTFIGFANYWRIFQDTVFLTSVRNSLIWTALGLFLQLTIPLGTALLLNQKFVGRTLARSVMLIPWITPGVLVAVMGRWMLEPGMGVVNQILCTFGVDRINFLGRMDTALPTLIGLQTWRFIPFGTLLMLAALQMIPRELYDAMKVDGAGPFKLFRFLIFPRLGPMIGFVSFLAFVWNFSVFDIIWLTTQGGPVTATMTMPILVYQRAFRMFRLGEASAIATILILGLTLVGIVYFKYLWKPATQE